MMHLPWRYISLHESQNSSRDVRFGQSQEGIANTSQPRSREIDLNRLFEKQYRIHASRTFQSYEQIISIQDECKFKHAIHENIHISMWYPF
jgi:hypothetical protein